MQNSNFVSRILAPESKPALPKRIVKPKIIKAGFFEVLFGFSVGIVTGLIIFTLFSIIGLPFGKFEASLLIGLPSILGMLTSLVIF